MNNFKEIPDMGVIWVMDEAVKETFYYFVVSMRLLNQSIMQVI